MQLRSSPFTGWRCDSLPGHHQRGRLVVSPDGPQAGQSRSIGRCIQIGQSRWLKRDHMAMVIRGGGERAGFLICLSAWIQARNGGTSSAGSTVGPALRPGARHLGRWQLSWLGSCTFLV